MSYDTIKSRSRRSAREWLNPKIGDEVYVHNFDSVLHGLRAKVVRMDFIAAELDFGCEIKVPGQAPMSQRIWRIPLDEIKFTPPEPKPARGGQS